MSNPSSRHSVAASLLLGALSLLAPRVAAQIAAYHDVDAAGHQLQFNTLSNSGYRPIALTAYGTTGSPLYAAVWVHRAGPNFIGFHGLTAGEYQTIVANNAASYAPTLLTARGTGSDARFAGVLEQTGYAVYARHGINATDLTTEIATATAQNWKIRTIDVYGSQNDPRYIVAFEPNPDNEGWGWYRANGVSGHQTLFEAASQSWAYPQRVGFNDDSSRFVTLWSDATVGLTIVRHDMTSGEYQNYANQYFNQLGYYPIDVQASGSGSSRRFAAVWAAQDLPLARQWSVHGTNVPELAAFDAWAQTYMQANAVRGASLAIVKDHKLVYAKGFNWAESGYPATQPVSLFRIASCNKPLTSIAVHQQLQKTPAAIQYGSAMAGYFGNPNFADQRSNNISVLHLLTHQGGWDRSTNGSNYDPMFIDTTVATALNKSLPISSTDIRNYMQGQPLDFTPGTQFQYSNYGFTLLGRIMEVLNPGKSFPQILQARVFDPLGITRAQVGASHLADRLPGEVLYHPRSLGVAQSVNDPSRPWVASQYGGWNQPNMDAHGAYVMAAPDFAKVLAAFDLGMFNPILGQGQTTNMWQPASGSNSWAKGWFKKTVSDGGAGTLDLMWHNGILSGERAFIGRREDGISFVFFTNGEGSLGSAQGEQLSDLANAVVRWPTHDLFPAVGLPPFRTVDDLATPFGSACPGSTGTPTLSGSGSSQIGMRRNLDLRGGAPGMPAVALIGVLPTAVDLGPVGAPRCTLFCDPIATDVVVTGRSGTATSVLSVPLDPSLVEAHVFAQFAIVDPRANQLGIAMSNGLDVVLGGYLGN